MQSEFRTSPIEEFVVGRASSSDFLSNYHHVEQKTV